MTEHSIIFSTDKVIQVLSGRTTQFRRIVKTKCNTCEEDGRLYFYDPNGTDGDDRHPAYVDAVKCCPYGQPGDLIRVQETWCQHENNADKFYYRADHPNDDSITDHWRSPMCMPRRACRIFLRNKAVRVERVLDISLINHDSARYHDASLKNPWVWVVEFELADVTRN